MGTPALVYDVGPASDFPEQALATLPFRHDEPVAALAKALASLLADPARLAARGQAARDHVRAVAGPAACARAYAEAIRLCHQRSA
jgi:hypothetical protein